jgi:quercetin 2,3-dioxygenase
MLVQSPSKIFKSDFSVWRKESSSLVNEIVFEENFKLRKTAEIVMDENGSFDFNYKINCTILVIVLYGEVLINDFEKPITAEQIFTLKSTESNILHIKNNLNDEKADVLLFELKSKKTENSFSVEDLKITEKNTLISISENVEYPNFIGLYDGRKEEEYSLYRKDASIFGMVINGAFEFQNRLMENRDAIILNEIKELEFEALSENALLIFLEI